MILMVTGGNIHKEMFLVSDEAAVPKAETEMAVNR